MSDKVNHPSHYNTGKIEVIEFIEDQKLDYHLGNSVKYIARAGKKNPEAIVEDLEKAIWYIRRRIELMADTVRRPNEMNPEASSDVPTSGDALMMNSNPVCMTCAQCDKRFWRTSNSLHTWCKECRADECNRSCEKCFCIFPTTWESSQKHCAQCRNYK